MIFYRLLIEIPSDIPLKLLLAWLQFIYHVCRYMGKGEMGQIGKGTHTNTWQLGLGTSALVPLLGLTTSNLQFQAIGSWA